MPVNAVPNGYHSIIPYLSVNGAAKAIEFYKKVFGATELVRMGGPDGKVGHAELKIGDAHIMLADEHPEMGFRSPKAFGGSPVNILVYLPDVDKAVERAVAAGGKLERPVKDQFYGDRSGQVVDPFGHVWTIATHIEDVSPQEMKKRAEEMFSQAAAK